MADRGIGVVHLHREEHDIDCADVRGRFGRAHVRHVEIAFRTEDAQAAGAQRLEVCAARDERDVGARGGQASAEVPTHTTAAEDGNLHGRLRLPHAEHHRAMRGHPHGELAVERAEVALLPEVAHDARA